MGYFLNYLYPFNDNISQKKVIITVNHVVLKSLPNLEINLFLNNVTENTTPPKHPIKLI